MGKISIKNQITLHLSLITRNDLKKSIKILFTDNKNTDLILLDLYNLSMF